MTESSHGRHRLVVTVIALALIPLAVAGTLIHEVFVRQDESERARVTNHWQRVLDSVIAAQDVVPPILAAVRAPMLETRYRWADAASIREMLRGRQRKYNILCRLYHFQHGRRQLVWPAGDPYEKRWRRVLAALPLTGPALAAAAARHDPWLRATFGRQCTLTRLQRHIGEYLPVRFGGQPGVLFVECGGDGLAFAFLVERLTPDEWHGYRAVRARLRPILHHVGRAVPDLGIWYPPRGLTTDDMRIAFSMAARQAGTPVQYRDRTWLFDTDRRGLVNALAVPTGSLGADLVTAATERPGSPRHAPGDARRTVIVMALLLLLTAGGRATLSACRVDAQVNPSIHRQLRWLFGIILFLPLGSALVLAWLSHEEKVEQLFRAAGKRSYETLQRITADFPVVRRRALTVSASIREQCATTPLDLDELAERVHLLRLRRDRLVDRA